MIEYQSDWSQHVRPIAYSDSMPNLQKTGTTPFDLVLERLLLSTTLLEMLDRRGTSALHERLTTEQKTSAVV